MKTAANFTLSCVCCFSNQNDRVIGSSRELQIYMVD